MPETPDYRSDFEELTLDVLKKTRDPAPELLVYMVEHCSPRCTNPDGHVFRHWPAGRAHRCETCGVYYSDVRMGAPISLTEGDLALRGARR